MRSVAKSPSPAAPGPILAIDPGYVRSAFVLYSLSNGRPVHFGIEPNETILGDIRSRLLRFDRVVIEQVAAMGMAVGAEVFETVYWSGRFCEAAECQRIPVSRVKRHEVKTCLCGNQRAKDPHIRQALIDRYGPGRELAIGRKATPGPLYGVSADVWAALAVAVTFADRVPAAPADAGEVRA